MSFYIIMEDSFDVAATFKGKCSSNYGSMVGGAC